LGSVGHYKTPSWLRNKIFTIQKYQASVLTSRKCGKNPCRQTGRWHIRLWWCGPWVHLRPPSELPRGRNKNQSISNLIIFWRTLEL